MIGENYDFFLLLSSFSAQWDTVSVKNCQMLYNKMFAYINYEFLEPQLSICSIPGWSDWVHLKMQTADKQALFQKIIIPSLKNT